jgi:hypothetical protein
MSETEGKYVVPRGDGKGNPLVLDLLAVARAERRLKDVAIVNSHTAAELLSTFNGHWLTCENAVTSLTYERNKAQATLDLKYAEAILSCNEEALKKKGHSKTSQDLREAMATISPEVIEAKERLNEIKAVLEFVCAKRSAFYNAYNSVKKLITPQLPTDHSSFGAGDPFGDRNQQRAPASHPDLGDDNIPDFSASNSKPSYDKEILSEFEEPRY